MSGILAAMGITGTSSTRTPNTLSPVFCCGFECGAGGTNAHWSALTSTLTYDAVTIRSGARSLRSHPTGTAGSVTCQAAANDTYIIRFYIRFATLPSADTYICWAGSSGARVGVAFKNSDSKIYAATASVPSFGATGIAVTTGTWYRIDAKIIQTSGAKSCDVQVDGAAVGQKTSTDATAAGQILIGVSANTSADMYFEDFVVSNTGADYPWGAGFVNHFIPTADGTHNITSAGDFKVGAAGANITNATTDSYLLIDEVPLDDTTPDTNDYINFALDSGGGAEYVEHVIGPASGVSTPAAGPRAVDVIYGYHAASTTSGNHTVKINDNGVEDTVNAFSAAGQTTTRYARKQYANAPSDSNAWGVTSGSGNFNNLKTRFGYSTDANPDQYLDCVMVEAEFA